MKKGLLILFCLIIQSSFTQNKDVYKRILCSKTDFYKFREKHISFDYESCREYSEDSICMDISLSEINILEREDIPYRVAIDDLTEYISNYLNSSRTKPLTIEEKLEKEIPLDWDYGSMGGYFTLDEIYAHMDNMAEKYPHLITKKKAIGTFKTHENRDIYMMKISDHPEKDENDEEEVLMIGVHHAREVITPHVMIYYMYYLLENYEKDDYIKYLVDNRQIVCVPCMNPDGYQYNVKYYPNGGGMWRKNRRPNNDNTFGVDLNRNYPYKWGYNDDGSSPITEEETYRGPSAASEPEIQAIMHLCETHRFQTAINFHSFGNYLLYGYGYDDVYLDDHDLVTAQAKILTANNHYEYGRGADVIGYYSNGEANDYMYEPNEKKPNKIFSYTAEVGASSYGFWPSKGNIIPYIQENKKLFLETIHMAESYLSVQAEKLFLSSNEGYITFKFHSIGRKNIENLNIKVVPQNQKEIEVDNFKTLSLKSGEKLIDSIHYTLKSNEDILKPIVLKVSYKLDGNSIEQEFSFYEDQTAPIYNFDLSKDEEWNSEGWFVDDKFEDSEVVMSTPFNQNINSLKESNLELNKTFDFRDAKFAYLKMRYNNYLGKSQAVVIVAEDSEGNEYPLQGKLSEDVFVGYADPLPAYIKNSQGWVEECILLNDFLGKSIQIKFVHYCAVNGETKRFVFNDFSIHILKSSQINELESDEDMKIYPQPLLKNENLTIEFAQNVFDQLSVINLQGQILFVKNIQGQSNCVLETKNKLIPGIYSCVLEKGNKRVVRKLVVR
ncbi:MAG: M14 family zinc carboxypeptidase [Bacteroidales bacterium]